MAINLTMALVQKGCRVLLVDGDLGLANVDVMLGLTGHATIRDVLTAGGNPMEVVMYQEPNLGVLPASSDVPDMVNMSPEDQTQLVEVLTSIASHFDFLLVDAAAEIGRSVLRFNTFVDYNVVVLSPDPTALTDAYALVKVLCRDYHRRHFQLLFNLVRDEREGERVCDGLTRVIHRFLHRVLTLRPEYLGFVPHDRAVVKVVRDQIPFIKHAPKSRASMPCSPWRTESRNGERRNQMSFHPPDTQSTTPRTPSWTHPWSQDAFLADFHIHSHYSRATSPQMAIPTLNRAAKQKGLKVVGTGDFTHPGYLQELRRDLRPDGSGLYVYRDDPDGTKFILTAEVANIFSQGGRNRRIHTVIFAPNLEVVAEIQERLSSLGKIASDGRPIFGFPVKHLVRLVRDVSSAGMVVPAHIWTPWFSLFGAKSGFDTLEDCFEEESEHIFAIETGLSSDPEMNWRLSALDGYTLLSNSDAHSPAKLGREANVFSCVCTYAAIMEAIKKPSKGFEGTVEFFPEEGKYHYDGHRVCGVCLPPAETRRNKYLCPVCGQPLTVGVLHRVEDLADRPEGFHPATARHNVHLIPLEEIITAAFGVKSITARVRKEYQRIVTLGETEMAVLLWRSEAELGRFVPKRILEGIIRMRRGEVSIRPGHDGLYGRISLFAEGEPNAEPGASKPPTSMNQMSLF